MKVVGSESQSRQGGKHIKKEWRGQILQKKKKKNLQTENIHKYEKLI